MPPCLCRHSLTELVSTPPGPTPARAHGGLPVARARHTGPLAALNLRAGLFKSRLSRAAGGATVPVRLASPWSY